MREYLYLFILIFSIFVSCDDGRIYEKEIIIPQEGLTVKLKAQLTGAETWNDRYSLVLAGFTEGNEYATISKVITSNIASDGMVEVSMSGIKDNVDEVELCMINRLRKRVVTFKQILKEDFPSNSDTIFMDAGKVDASMFEAIQANAFNASCVGCHGGNGNAVRGLFLTEGKSYEGLVGKASKVNPDMLLVNPGKAQKSFLPLILEEDGHVAHSHIDILDAKKKTALVTLIKDWINNGAKE